MAKKTPKFKTSPQDVMDIRRELDAFLKTEDDENRQIGGCQCGVYAFFDYDGEPIYVGQTIEQLRGRIGRHLTGRRSDAVAKHVLDPLEVAEMEVWPFFDVTYPKGDSKEAKEQKNDADNKMKAAEYTVFQQLIRKSAFGALLNEDDIKPRGPSCFPSPIAPESFLNIFFNDSYTQIFE